MKSVVVAMLDIGEAFIPCVWILCVVHVKNVHDHPVYDLYLTINLVVEGHGLSELGFQQRLEASQECA